MFLRLLLLFQVILFFTGCTSTTNPLPNKLIIGLVSYGESENSIDKYSGFKDYLAAELNSFIELEPTYNEIKAIEQIERQRWDIVFAPPGLAAIAIPDAQYKPIFPLEGGGQNQSVIVVSQESPITELAQLAGKTIALSQPGSATGYYVPIYNLYGLTLNEVRIAPTPKAIAEWLVNKEVDAGAMSLDKFEDYTQEFSSTPLRILYRDSHPIPSGSILIASKLEETQQKRIVEALKKASPQLVQSTGYIPNAPIPKYEYLIEVVNRVEPIAQRIKQKPVPLYEPSSSPNPQ